MMKRGKRKVLSRKLLVRTRSMNSRFRMIRTSDMGHLGASAGLRGAGHAAHEDLVQGGLLAPEGGERGVQLVERGDQGARVGPGRQLQAPLVAAALGRAEPG